MKNGDLKRFYPDDGNFDPKDFARLDKDGKISKDQIPETVIANPTLAGTEQDLTGLEVNGTKYKVPEGTVVEANPTLAGTEDLLSGIKIGDTKYKAPANTIANPTLAGTEDALTGLQVGDTKYKIPEGAHLYKHSIITYNNTIVGWNIRIIYYSTDSAAYTAETFAAKLTYGENIELQGYVKDTSGFTGFLTNAYKASGSILTCNIIFTDFSVGTKDFTVSLLTNFADTVTQII